LHQFLFQKGFKKSSQDDYAPFFTTLSHDKPTEPTP